MIKIAIFILSFPDVLDQGPESRSGQIRGSEAVLPAKEGRIARMRRLLVGQRHFNVKRNDSCARKASGQAPIGPR